MQISPSSEMETKSFKSSRYKTQLIYLMSSYLIIIFISQFYRRVDYLDQIFLEWTEQSLALESIITCVFFFNTRIKKEKIIHVLRTKLCTFPRFTSILIKPSLSSREYEWQQVNEMDFNYHLVQMSCKEKNKMELHSFISELQNEASDITQPLWRCYMVPMEKGGMALVTRIHHCIGDGTTLVHVLFSVRLLWLLMCTRNLSDSS